MSKIFKPLIFVITLVVAFAIGYALGSGKDQGVDNSDEIKRLQKQVSQKSKQVAALQQSLDVLKQEQASLRKDLQESQKQLGATSTAPVKDAYAETAKGSNTAVGDLTFYNDLPKQEVTPEPLKADPAKTVAATAEPSVNPVKLAEQAKQAATKPEVAGTSSKPLKAGEAQKPATASAAETNPATTKHKSALPARYIPPGFNGATAVKSSKAKATTQYVVQLASYKTESATKTLRKNLGKLGFAADVRKATLKDGATVYRVVVGPYAGYSKASAARSDLKKKTKLDGLILKAG